MRFAEMRGALPHEHELCLVIRVIPDGLVWPDAWLANEYKIGRELAAFNTLEIQQSRLDASQSSPGPPRLTGFELDSSHECAART